MDAIDREAACKAVCERCRFGEPLYNGRHGIMYQWECEAAPLRALPTVAPQASEPRAPRGGIHDCGGPLTSPQNWPLAPTVEPARERDGGDQLIERLRAALATDHAGNCGVMSGGACDCGWEEDPPRPSIHCDLPPSPPSPVAAQGNESGPSAEVTSERPIGAPDVAADDGGGGGQDRARDAVRTLTPRALRFIANETRDRIPDVAAWIDQAANEIERLRQPPPGSLSPATASVGAPAAAAPVLSKSVLKRLAAQREVVVRKWSERPDAGPLDGPLRWEDAGKEHNACVEEVTRLRALLAEVEGECALQVAGRDAAVGLWNDCGGRLQACEAKLALAEAVVGAAKAWRHCKGAPSDLIRVGHDLEGAVDALAALDAPAKEEKPWRIVSR